MKPFAMLLALFAPRNFFRTTGYRVTGYRVAVHRVAVHRVAFFTLALLLLAGCEEELYRSIPERDVNLMISILHHHHISARKDASQPEGYYTIYVEQNAFAQAVELLSVKGYPRRNHKNLGELFQPSGLVPTQFEEQVRYVYGLSEELSHTISLFDGVVDTRVHIALPNQENLKEGARVSVYIKYDQDIDFESLTPQVKKLVSDSIGKVSYKNVEVLASPAYFHKSDGQILTAYEFPAGIRVLPEYYSFFITFCVAILLTLVQLAFSSFWFYKKWKESEARQKEQPAVDLIEAQEEGA